MHAAIIPEGELILLLEKKVTAVSFQYKNIVISTMDSIPPGDDPDPDHPANQGRQSIVEITIFLYWKETAVTFF